jgi:hypothetical protein
MNLRNRQRLLAFARLLDRRAARIREFVKRRTPKRGPRQKADSLAEAEKLHG